MRLDPEQLAVYDDAGYLVVPDVMPEAAVARLSAELPGLCARGAPSQVREVDGVTVRSLYGSHLEHELFASLARHPSMLDPARQLLGGDVYVYQMKINLKSANTGDAWPWHQDLIYWRREDGLRGAEIVNVVLFLDDADEANGAMRVIPGSHRAGVIDVPARSGDRPEAYRASAGWIDDVIAAIKYSIDPARLAPLEAGRVVTLKARRGSLLLFHPNLVHCSPPNRSPRDRRLLFVTYNRTDNLAIPVGEPRPEFLVGRDRTPLVGCPDPRFEH